MNCIFCKIASGEIPSHKLYEDDEFIAILDAFPSSPGHALVIPKAHAEDVFGLDEDTACRAFALAARLSKKVKAALGCEGINILQNNGEAAGQTVSHFHVHIIPRYKGDSVTFKWKSSEPSGAELEAVLKRINSAEG